MPKPKAVARELGRRIEALALAELVAKRHEPSDRAAIAHHFLDELAALESTVRALRGDSIRKLRAADETWISIGALLDVTPQRAHQLAAPQITEALEP